MELAFKPFEVKFNPSSSSNYNCNATGNIFTVFNNKIEPIITFSILEGQNYDVFFSLVVNVGEFNKGNGLYDQTLVSNRFFPGTSILINSVTPQLQILAKDIGFNISSKIALLNVSIQYILIEMALAMGYTKDNTIYKESFIYLPYLSKHNNT